MAGAFGFEPDHLALANALGERALLPAIRNATPDTAVIADGFSCREQIRQGTGEKALHIAEILRNRLLGFPDEPPTKRITGLGALESGIADLGSNKKYLKGFGGR